MVKAAALDLMQNSFNLLGATTLKTCWKQTQEFVQSFLSYLAFSGLTSSATLAMTQFQKKMAPTWGEWVEASLRAVEYPLKQV